MRLDRSPIRLTWLLAFALAAGGAALWACSSKEDQGSPLPGAGAEAGLDEGGGDDDGATVGDGAPINPGDGGADAHVMTPREACVAYVNALCARREHCGVSSFGGCTNAAALCPDFLFAPGSTQTVDQVVACADVRATQPCEEVTRGIDPPCVTVGTRTEADSCQFNVQCASGRCGGAASLCGHCMSIIAPDGGCPAYNATCGPNNTCAPDGVGCVPIAVPSTLAVGASCVADAGADAARCPFDAPCVANAAGATSGACTTLPSTGPCLFTLGANVASRCAVDSSCLRVDPGLPGGECVGDGVKNDACGIGNGNRKCAAGFFCNDGFRGICIPAHKQNEPCLSTQQCEATLQCDRQPTDAFGKCVPRAPLGAPCGTVSVDGGFVTTYCEPEARCEFVAVDGGPNVQICRKASGLGEPCSAPERPCVFGLSCKSGTCALDDCTIDAGDGG